MSLFILKNHIVNLYLCFGMITTLSFDSEIISYMYGGGFCS
jgi:hypothetical protein